MEELREEAAVPDVPPEDYLGRMYEARWNDLAHIDSRDFVDQMRVYIAEDDAPMYNDDHRLMQQMMWALARTRPAIAPLKGLLGPRPQGKTEVDESLLKRDYVAVVVVNSLMIRADRGDASQKDLYDGIVWAGLNFSFDPLYGEAPMRTEVEVGDWMIKRAKLTPDSIAAVERYLEPLIERWRKRVATNSSAATMGFILRFTGAKGLDRLFEEWGRMDEDERLSLLGHAAYGEITPNGLEKLVEAMLQQEDLDHRRAAIQALEQHGAPVLEVDASSREDEIRKAAKKVRDWIVKTRS